MLSFWPNPGRPPRVQAFTVSSQCNIHRANNACNTQTRRYNSGREGKTRSKAISPCGDEQCPPGGKRVHLFITSIERQQEEQQQRTSISDVYCTVQYGDKQSKSYAPYFKRGTQSRPTSRRIQSNGLVLLVTMINHSPRASSRSRHRCRHRRFRTPTHKANLLLLVVMWCCCCCGVVRGRYKSTVGANDPGDMLTAPPTIGVTDAEAAATAAAAAAAAAAVTPAATPAESTTPTTAEEDASSMTMLQVNLNNTEGTVVRRMVPNNATEAEVYSGVYRRRLGSFRCSIIS